MSEKYELIEIPKSRYFTVPGEEYKVFVIKALRDIPRHKVKKGDLGGFVYSDQTLSQEGDCWMAEQAIASENVRITGNALLKEGCNISGSVQISGNCVLDNVFANKRVKISGDCYLSRVTVYDDCSVSGNVKIINTYERYRLGIFGTAQIHSNEDFLLSPAAWSSGRHSIAYKLEDGTITVCTGCFQGSLDEYLEAIKKTHTGLYLWQYKRFHKRFMKHFGLYKPKKPLCKLF